MKNLYNSSSDYVLQCYRSIGMRMFFDDYMTSEVSDLLNSEKQVICEILNIGEYKHLVEGGCGFGRAACLARLLNINYDGCEIVKDWLPVAENNIKRLGFLSDSAKITIGSVERLEKTNCFFGRPLSQDSLVLLPFNLFGNLKNPYDCLNSARLFSSSVAITTFNYDTSTTDIRMDYYSQCGFTELQIRRDIIGTIITGSNHLASWSYKPEIIEIFARNAGFSKISSFTINHGLVILLRP
jgi:hypothetical protein